MHDVQMASWMKTRRIELHVEKSKLFKLIRANIRRLSNWYTRAILVLSYLWVRIEEANDIQPTDRVENVQTPPTDRGEAGDRNNLDSDDEGDDQK